LVGSRASAQRLITAGRVIVPGVVTPKPSTMVASDATVHLTGPPDRFVGRGGEKLAHALERFAIDVTDRAAIDLGASTGGFTDCLLQAGARHVTTVDVGYNQLDYRLRTDPRVTALERTNVRTMDPDSVDRPFEVIVADLSFISLELVMPTIAALADDSTDIVVLVKPQFEVGKESVSRGGVVRDPALWRQAVDRVSGAATQHGLGARGLVASPIRGASAGNREFLMWLRRGESRLDESAYGQVFTEGESP
jgi:23S rRNA (cytidine1920-2'-O)/16S rRNA (cytidine1409-2'-O)-methyltransferase